MDNLTSPLHVLPRRGLLDSHNHLLPGIDDGCRNVDESLLCIKSLCDKGYVGAICTPHGGPPSFAENTPDLIARSVEQLQLEIEKADLEFHIFPGSELSLTPNLVNWLEENGVQALAVNGDAREHGKGAVLFDYWGKSWDNFCDEFIDYLLNAGLTPVLAHPERMGIREPWVELMTSLRERGVLLQGNLRPLTGYDGLLTQYRTEQLLDMDAYSMLCLDAHRPGCLPPRLEGLSRLRLGWGRKKFRAMVVEGPRNIAEIAFADPGG